MQAWILAAVLLAMPASATAPTAAHVKAKVGCVDCHGEAAPAKPAPASACMGCHGDYPAMAETTAKLPVNPHDSHLGAVACTKCHAQHRPGKVLCLDCHEFDLNLK